MMAPPPSDALGKPLFLVVLLAIVSLVPIVFMATTAFVKISTVLQITRNAIGAQNVPSNFAVLVPAFIVSELNRAFALGVAVFLPFLVLDLVVANILVAGGLASLSPTQVALPLKLLLFLAVDGWGLLARALMLGYRF
jgi:type III secretory pathway component EscR